MYRWIYQCNGWGSVTCFPQQQLENYTKPKIVSFGFKPNVSITSTTQNKNTTHKWIPYSVYRSSIFTARHIRYWEKNAKTWGQRYGLWLHSFSKTTWSLYTNKREIITLESLLFFSKDWPGIKKYRFFLKKSESSYRALWNGSNNFRNNLSLNNKFNQLWKKRKLCVFIKHLVDRWTCMANTMKLHESVNKFFSFIVCKQGLIEIVT